ncbi:hypothetical protein [Tenacibaculum jejuense]|uniref:Uncharacterized protein n=1 Tax=Tenacibaculum jejuense TaxID=584609 RepID=A0A238UAN3_9FLAO|nr:hypothetical protein [Tenacibaculum jejuense]SNR16253.1 Protein of unknown function precursor [Tenacibaculum jejuense]
MKYIFYACVILLSWTLQAQKQSMLDKLNDLQLKRLENLRNWTKKDSLNTLISKTIASDDAKLFVNTDTTQYYLVENKLRDAKKGIRLAYAFINNIIINTNEDIRVFSTDVLDNGSFHEYLNYIQFKTKNQTWKVINLDKSQQDKSVGFYKVDKINNYYILLGYGTYGSGKQHFVIRVFEKKNDDLIENIEAYPNKELFFIECNRSQNIDLNFNPDTKELSFKQFKMDDDTGFYTRKFDLKKFKFINGKFTQE